MKQKLQPVSGLHFAELFIKTFAETFGAQRDHNLKEENKSEVYGKQQFLSTHF